MDQFLRSGGITNPEHHYFDDTAYFITAATYEHRRWLKSDEVKATLRDLLHQVFAEYGWTLDHW
jgi:REP element-mobilizing transposase RayT